MIFHVDPLGKIPYVNLPGLYAQRGQNDEALELQQKRAVPGNEAGA